MVKPCETYASNEKEIDRCEIVYVSFVENVKKQPKACDVTTQCNQWWKVISNVRQHTQPWKPYYHKTLSSMVPYCRDEF